MAIGDGRNVAPKTKAEMVEIRYDRNVATEAEAEAEIVENESEEEVQDICSVRYLYTVLIYPGSHV